MSVLLTMEDVIRTVTTLLVHTTVPATQDTYWIMISMDALVILLKHKYTTLMLSAVLTLRY